MRLLESILAMVAMLALVAMAMLCGDGDTKNMREGRI
jgi:hypothetical protein